MDVEINFTYHIVGLPLCLLCDLGAIFGHFKRRFGSVLLAVLHILVEKLN